MTKEWTAEQYDEFYKESEEYRKPYKESIYWPVWQEVLKRIPRNVIVLELGCGTGQFADALYDRGVLNYLGVDFSLEATKIANKRRGVYLHDILKFVPPHDYDYLVCLETLEHIEDDIGVLNRIRPGKRCLITVPSYDGPNHVRFFPTEADVLRRYRKFLTAPPQYSTLGITPLSLNDHQTIYLIDGVRNEHN